jgi:hypothetical protein
VDIVEVSIKQLESSKRSEDGDKVSLFKTNHSQRLIELTTLVLMLTFIAGQFLLALHRSPSADDALFLSVPKNWLNGYGWATSYSEKIPFNPDFTGPTALLLPAALLIKLFGTQWWIGGVTGWAVNSVLSALCLWQIRYYGKNSALSMLCLACGIVAGFAQDFSSLIGYYTGSLLFLLASCLAFNPLYTVLRRATLIGVMTGISLLIKPLLIPAFIGLSLLFFYATAIKKAKQLIFTLMALLIPPLLISSTNSLLQEHALQAYPPSYQESYRQYKKDFIDHHGSGLGQWEAAKEKIPYLIRNANKNLYFVEEGLSYFGIKNPFLGDAPADVNHIVGTLYLIGLIVLISLSAKKIIAKKTASPSTWLLFTLSSCILIYALWFVLFAMAMSPGHLYFPMQWTLWLFFLLPAYCSNTRASHCVIAATAICLSLFYVMDTGSRKAIFLQNREEIIQTSGLDQATDHLKTTFYLQPLAGCGYSNYPRHIEYRLDTSQNFSDCLDLINDHVIKRSEHYEWKSPLSFTLVLSLQSMSFNPATDPIIAACQHNILYRNRDIFIFQCAFDDLQKLKLDTLMPAIQATHQWYKTRLP